MASENFSIQLSDVLQMIFITDQLYLSLHWSGDTDFEDTRIWIQKVIDDEKAEPVLVYNSFEMASFTHRYIFGLEKTSLYSRYFPQEIGVFRLSEN